MKILSPFKDYYDFLQGVDGVDERVVYHRVCQQIKYREDWESIGTYKPTFQLDSFFLGFATYVLAIAGEMLVVYWKKGKFYFGEEFERAGFEDKYKRSEKYHLQKSNINERQDCPVLLLHYSLLQGGELQAVVKNPKLEDFMIQRILPPRECFQKIYDFLSKQPEVVDHRTNAEKVVSNGFDLKTSFRNV